MTSEIVRSFDLPFGYNATFHWKAGHLDVIWEPTVPNIRSNRAQRKLLLAYQSARRSFFTEIAAIIGAGVFVADIDDLQAGEIIPPPTKN
jgi:hypothetical protein